MHQRHLYTLHSLRKKPRDVQSSQINRKRAQDHLLLAMKEIEAKNYTAAKQDLIFAVDIALQVNPMDDETKRIIYLCCEHTALLQKTLNQRRKQNRLDSYDQLILNSRKKKKQHKLLVLDFDKRIGQFVFEQADKKNADILVKFNVAKLNGIMFGYSNIKTKRSISVLLHTYTLAFAVFMLLSFVLLLLLTTTFLEYVVSQNHFESYGDYAVIIIASAFCLPLILIYGRTQDQQQSGFLDKKLGTQILNINSSMEGCSFHLDDGKSLRIVIEV